MTDLERKLAETLREQAGEVTPNLDAAWAEQQRRQQRRPRRRAVVWIAPLAAVLVLLTSVLLATQLNPVAAPAAGPPMPVMMGPPEHRSMGELNLRSAPVRLMDFPGSTDNWTSYAFTANLVSSAEQTLFCLAALPVGEQFDISMPQYSVKSPVCTTILSNRGLSPVRAGYVGEWGGPLPPGKVVYLVDSAVLALQVVDTNGNLSEARDAGRFGADRLLLADAEPGTTPRECWIS